MKYEFLEVEFNKKDHDIELIILKRINPHGEEVAEYFEDDIIKKLDSMLNDGEYKHSLKLEYTGEQNNPYGNLNGLTLQSVMIVLNPMSDSGYSF